MTKSPYWIKINPVLNIISTLTFVVQKRLYYFGPYKTVHNKRSLWQKFI